MSNENLIEAVKLVKDLSRLLNNLRTGGFKQELEDMALDAEDLIAKIETEAADGTDTNTGMG